MINLNNKMIFLEKYPCGKHMEEVKIGRNFYIIEINKNAIDSELSLYKKLGKDRKSYSKYDKNANLHAIFVKNDILIDRQLLERIEELEKAQSLVREYHGILA